MKLKVSSFSILDAGNIIKIDRTDDGYYYGKYLFSVRYFLP